MTQPKSAPGRWTRISRTRELQLVIGGVFTAGITKAGAGVYVWRLFGDQRTGTSCSEYAAQRAVRRALREGANQA